MSGPLAGVRVLDLTRVLSGPFATLLLADLGAEIWKVEHPDGGDETRQIQPSIAGQSHYFMAVNRNKASIAIDLKTDRGRDLVVALAARADVVVENFRPGVATRLGLDHEQLRQVNPRLVYCSISAFGQDGPDATRTAFDVAIQALGGLMSITGERDGAPVRAGVPIADLVAGLMADIGILAALTERASTGEGRYVDVSMLDSVVGLLTYYAGRYLMTGEEPARVGAGHLSVVPYGVYPAADGDLVIATLSESYWPRLCALLGRDDLGRDARLATNADRVAHRAEVEAAVSDALRQRSVAEWQAILTAADIPHAPILSVGQVLAHPQVVARGMVTQVEHPVAGGVGAVGSVVKFPGHEPTPARPAPLLGEHTIGLLHDVLGLGQDEIDVLVRDAVVAAAAAPPADAAAPPADRR